MQQTRASHLRSDPNGLRAARRGLVPPMAAVYIAVAALVLLLVTPAARAAAETPLTAQLLANQAPLVAGQDATLAVQVDIAAGYHIQGARPYDKFLKATSAKLLPAAGLSAGAVQYPVARDIPASTDITDAGKLAVYEGRIWILIPIHIDPAAQPGTRTLAVALQTQACNDQACLPPETTKLSLPVQIAPAGTTAQPQAPALFATARQQVFMDVAPATAPVATRQAESAPIPPATVATTTTASDSPAEDQELSQIHARPYHAANRQADDYSLLSLLLLALAGGAILNIMPCVLPVIPLKILSLVQQAHGHRGTAVAHALVFSAGVVTLFVALAAALGSYQLVTGTKVIYGEQYSNPAFILVTALIVLALALSMLGVWTINTPQKAYAIAQPQTGYAASFMTGVLATVLATPCSAPLLGPVLFWALVHPLPVTMLAFALVGVGMSVPYIVLAAFPAGLERLPRAGRWSELLKQGLGLVMIGVALYLITRIPNPQIWPWALAAALLMGAVCWAWGQIPSPVMEPRRAWIIRTVIVVLGVAAGWGLYVSAQAQPPAPRGAIMADGTGWQPFSIAALDAGLNAGQPIVVDWTANWCINCRVVEATVLESQAVKAAFASHHAVLLRADLSGENPPAKELLLKLGGGSIPFLAIFSPQHKFEPMVLQDAYGRQTVIDGVGQAAER